MIKDHSCNITCLITGAQKHNCKEQCYLRQSIKRTDNVPGVQAVFGENPTVGSSRRTRGERGGSAQGNERYVLYITYQVIFDKFKHFSCIKQANQVLLRFFLQEAHPSSAKYTAIFALIHYQHVQYVSNMLTKCYSGFAFKGPTLRLLNRLPYLL